MPLEDCILAISIDHAALVKKVMDCHRCISQSQFCYGVRKTMERVKALGFRGVSYRKIQNIIMEHCFASRLTVSNAWEPNFIGCFLASNKNNVRIPNREDIGSTFYTLDQSRAGPWILARIEHNRICSFNVFFSRKLKDVLRSISGSSANVFGSLVCTSIYIDEAPEVTLEVLQEFAPTLWRQRGLKIISHPHGLRHPAQAFAESSVALFYQHFRKNDN